MQRARRGLFALAALGAAALAGCGSAPYRVEIFVDTTPPGATCALSRSGEPIATAGPSPAIALVAPGDDPITIVCRRPGYADATVTLPSHLSGYGLGLFAGHSPYGYQHRVEIALTPKPR